MRKLYSTDLSDAEWAWLEPHLPAPKASGRPRVYPLREILNAIFYLVRSGCSWRLLPHDFPPWRRASTTTSDSFPLGRGTWARGARSHTRAGEGAPQEKSSTQRPGIVDSQSVKTTGVGGEEQRGYDGGKRR